MNIKDFVADTLTQICAGIKKAQDNTEQYGACISPRITNGIPTSSNRGHTDIQKVSFDIAVDVVKIAEETKAGTSFKLEVSCLSTSIGNGTKKENANTNRDAIRIQFDVPVCWPNKPYERN